MRLRFTRRLSVLLSVCLSVSKFTTDRLFIKVYQSLDKKDTIKLWKSSAVEPDLRIFKSSSSLQDIAFSDMWLTFLKTDRSDLH